MANNDRPRKKSPTRQAQGVPPAPGDTDQEFFAKVKVDAQSLTADPSVLLNIPVWGWQYSGKTCAILTAVHYCQAQMHGIGLARVKDMSDLNEMASKFEAYRGLQLATLAEATSTRLSELSELFFVDLEWPPGTDSPMHYLL